MSGVLQLDRMLNFFAALLWLEQAFCEITLLEEMSRFGATLECKACRRSRSPYMVWVWLVTTAFVVVTFIM
jgi:hypothetical protein